MSTTVIERLDCVGAEHNRAETKGTSQSGVITSFLGNKTQVSVGGKWHSRKPITDQQAARLLLSSPPEAHFGAMMASGYTGGLAVPIGRPLTIDIDSFCLPVSHPAFQGPVGQELLGRVQGKAVQLALLMLNHAFGFPVEKMLVQHSGGKGAHIIIQDGSHLSSVARKQVCTYFWNGGKSMEEFGDLLDSMRSHVGVDQLATDAAALLGPVACGGTGYFDSEDGAPRRRSLVDAVMGTGVEACEAVDGGTFLERLVSQARATQREKLLNAHLYTILGPKLDLQCTADINHLLRMPLSLGSSGNSRATPVDSMQVLRSGVLPRPLPSSSKVPEETLGLIEAAFNGENARPNAVRAALAHRLLQLGPPTETAQSTADQLVDMSACIASKGIGTTKKVTDTPLLSAMDIGVFLSLTDKEKEVFAEMHTFDIVPSSEWPANTKETLKTRPLDAKARVKLIPSMILGAGVPPALVVRLLVAETSAQTRMIGVGRAREHVEGILTRMIPKMSSSYSFRDRATREVTISDSLLSELEEAAALL